jgi:CBS domain-containing protein
MLAKDLMTCDVVTCQVGETLADAACRMWDRDCGVMPVVDARGAPIGMITDRDIAIACWSHGQAPENLRVACAMSGTVVSCEPDTPLESIEHRMRQHQVRRLPVVDGEGRLAGIVSIADLASVIDRRSADETSAVAHTLAAISARRLRHGEPILAGEEVFSAWDHTH